MTVTLRLVRKHSRVRPADLRAGDVIIDPSGNVPDYKVLADPFEFRDCVVAFCDHGPQKWTAAAAEYACVARLERS